MILPFDFALLTPATERQLHSGGYFATATTVAQPCIPCCYYFRLGVLFVPTILDVDAVVVVVVVVVVVAAAAAAAAVGAPRYYYFEYYFGEELPHRRDSQLEGASAAASAAAARIPRRAAVAARCERDTLLDVAEVVARFDDETCAAEFAFLVDVVVVVVVVAEEDYFSPPLRGYPSSSKLSKEGDDDYFSFYPPHPLRSREDGWRLNHSPPSLSLSLYISNSSSLSLSLLLPSSL